MYTFSTLSIKYHKIILNFRKPKKKNPDPFLNLLNLIIIVISLFIEKKILISTMYKYMYTAVSAYHSSSTKSIIPDREHNLHFCLIGVTSNLDANPAS